MRFSLRRTVPMLSLLVVLVPLTTFGAFTQVTTFAGGGGAFSQPTGIAITPAGDLIVADRDHHQIKRVSPIGVVTIIAGTGALGDLDGAANVAQFKSPVAVAYDAPRELIYVADTQSDSIRKIDGNGNVSTFAANGFTDPSGVAVDSSGNVYVADTGNNKIKKITPAGVVTTIAGAGQAAYLDGAALSAKFRNPYGLAITAGGVLYIADQKNHVIRKLDNGTVSTVAGTGTNGLVDGPALSAKFTEPKGIAFDASGNLIVADSNNEVIRLVTFGASPTVSTIAGTGALGLVNGPPLSAKFREPSGIAFAGAIYVADAGNDVIRAISPSATLTGITMVPSGASLTVGATALLTAFGNYNDGTSADVRTTAVWTSSNTAIATVTSYGVVSGLAEGDAVISATFGGFIATAAIHVTSPEALPPDPALIAPPIDPTKITTVFETTRFLYEGTPRVQSGVATGIIDLRRAAVLRGFVEQRGGGALAGVTVTILGHPEYGHTISRTDGHFDMAVNGGESLTVQYRKPDFIAVDRQLFPRWNNWKVADDVAMVPYDTSVTAVDLSAAGVKVARGTTTDDLDGVRTPTLFFLPGTTATMTMPDGTSSNITSLHIRATEYTVGQDGPKAMPAALPSQTAYTYCVELSADEAVAASASNLSFSSPVIHYLDSFIDFPAGSIVPVGWYDRATGTWLPADNGIVVKIVDIVNGRAYLDITGDGLADDSDTLIGTTPEERTQLAALYHAGQSLWRMKITHFTPWDGNFPYGPPSGAAAPKDGSDPTLGGGGGPVDDCSQCPGSILSIENQTLGENVPVLGTPLQLHYESERLPGHTESRNISVKVSGDTIPPAVGMRAVVTIAGKQLSQNFPPAPNLTANFVWDGTDAYGRPVQGTVSSDVSVEYDYHLVYASGPTSEQGSSAFLRQWAEFESSPQSVIFPRRIPPGTDGEKIFFTMHRDQHKDFDIGLPVRLGHWDARGVGFGGWTLNLQHTYDHSSQTLYLGGGQRQTLQGIGPTITTVAGGGNDSSDGSAATNALITPRDVSAGPDSTLYITDASSLRAVAPNGTITTLAGGGTIAPGITPIPAANAAIDADRVVVDRNGTFYLAETNQRRVLRLQNGMISVVAGNGNYDPSLVIKESRATDTPIRPVGISLDGSGNLLIATGTQVLTLRPDGNVQAYIGNGQYFNPDGTDPNGDGGAAGNAPLTNPSGVLVSGAGTTIVSSPDTHNIRMVDVDGLIHTIASGHDNSFGSSGPISTAPPICIDRNNTIYIAEGSRVYQIRPDGTRVPVAGSGSQGNEGDGGPALQAKFNKITGLSIGSDGALYIADAGFGSGGRVRRLARTMPGLQLGETAIPSADGSSIDVFDGDGRHLRTLDALQGFVRYSFTYNALGYATAITDVHGNVVTIERDTVGRATAIVAPGGQRTTLAYDGGSGYLLSVTDSASQAFRFTYYTGQADGLLATLTTPRNQTHSFTFDAQGRLTADSDPAGGFTTLSSSIAGHLQTVTTHSAEGVTGTYLTQINDDGSLNRSVTDGAGITTSSTQNAEGTDSSQSPTGSSTAHIGPDPRFNMLSPFANGFTSTIGSVTLQGTVTRNVALVDPNNELSAVASSSASISVNGRTYQVSYDGPSRTITSTSPQGRSTLMTLDFTGQIVSAAVPGIMAVDYGHDAKGQLTTAVQGARTSTFAYDSENRLASITDSLQRTMAFEYDNADRVTKETLADGRFLLFHYDADGNVISVTPPSRTEHAFSFTPVDSVSGYAPPPVAGGGATLFSYDRDRRLKTVTRPDGSTISRSYDSAGLLVALTIARGTYQVTWNSVTGNLSSVADPDGGSIVYAYDGSLLKSATFIGAVPGSINWHYDQDLALADETVNCATATTLACQSVVFRYDNDKLLTLAGALNIARDFYNGSLIGSTVSNVSDQWTYNEFGEPSAYTATLNGSDLFSEQFTRDDTGRITQKSETIGSATSGFSYGYDPMGHLTDVTENGENIAHYVYDENGNRISRTPPVGIEAGTYDAQDRLVSYNGSEYSYTAAGELSTRSDLNGTTAFTYDELGNLIRASLVGGTVIDYVIDGQNRRVGKKVNGTLVQRFIYAGQVSPAAELDENGDVVARFVYGTRPNVPDLIIKGDATYRVITDHLGSPRMIVNVDDGSVAERIDFDEFGRVLLDSNPDFQPFGFAGGLYDSDTKLLRFGARDYDPQTGRWSVKDPLLFGGGDTNFYVYAANDPINWTDVTGLAYGDLSDIRATVAGYDQYAAMAEPGTLRGMAKVASFMLNNFGMAAAQQSGEAFGNGDWVCGSLRGVQSSFQGATLAFAPSGLNNIGSWIKSPFWYEMGQKTLTDAAFEGLKHLPEAERGVEIVSTMGWRKALFDFSGAWWKTFGQGPTPGAYLGIAGLGKGMSAVSARCGCN